jgi:hypothetical protein
MFRAGLANVASVQANRGVASELSQEELLKSAPRGRIPSALIRY